MIKKYATLRIDNSPNKDLVIETTGYEQNYRYRNEDLIEYCRKYAPKDPTKSPSFTTTLKHYHWKTCPQPTTSWLLPFLEHHKI